MLGDEQWFIDEAAKQDVKITHVIDTHVHADHFSGGRKLAELTGAKYCLHESNAARIEYPFEPLKDGQRIEVGNVFVDVVHTPGHTPDSICLLVTDKRRTETPWFMLTGDTLFVGDVGRPDFGGIEGGREQFVSVQRLLGLEDYVEVFPAHFEGFCGKGMCGRPSTTIGFERRFNPLSFDVNNKSALLKGNRCSLLCLTDDVRHRYHRCF